MEFHKVVPVGLSHNAGGCCLGEASCDGFDSEHHAVCWCRSQTQSLSASSL